MSSIGPLLYVVVHSNVQSVFLRKVIVFKHIGYEGLVGDFSRCFDECIECPISPQRQQVQDLPTSCLTYRHTADRGTLLARDDAFLIEIVEYGLAGVEVFHQISSPPLQYVPMFLCHGCHGDICNVLSNLSITLSVGVTVAATLN